MTPSSRPHEPESAGCLSASLLLMLAILCVCALLVALAGESSGGMAAAFLQEFEERTGIGYQSSNQRFHSFPTPGLTLTGPRLYDSPSTVLVFAGAVRDRVAVVPPPEGRIVAKDLVIDHPQGDRTSDGRMETGPLTKSLRLCRPSDTTRSFKFNVVQNLLVVQRHRDCRR